MTCFGICLECTNRCERVENHRVHRCTMHRAFSADYKVRCKKVSGNQVDE